jgi:hypothetical protein
VILMLWKRKVRAALLSGLWTIAISALAGAGVANAKATARRGIIRAPKSESQSAADKGPSAQTSVAASGRSSTKSRALDQNERVTLPAGTVISIRLADTVNSNHNHPGDQFTGTVDPSVLVGDRVVIPRGTEARVRMTKRKKGGHLHGHAEVQLELTSLVINGRKFEVESDTYQEKEGVMASKIKGEAKASANPAADLVVSGLPSDAADPVIAIFRAAKVVKPAGSKIDFSLISPFTFKRIPVGPSP